MGTNYYVQTPPCPNACEHCSATERIHLGKSSAGWRFLLYADPEWPRDEAFAHWVRRALSGQITDEYGHQCTLADLMNLADGTAEGISHVTPRPGRPNTNDFRSGGFDFSDREFS